MTYISYILWAIPQFIFGTLIAKILDIESNGYSLGLIPGCDIAAEIARRPAMGITVDDVARITAMAAAEWTTPSVIAQHAVLIPAATQAEQFAAIERSFDHHIDGVAASHGYGRVGVRPSASCIGFAGYPNQWQAEAIKYGQWVRHAAR